MDKGGLKDYGYTLKEPRKERRSALKKVIKAVGIGTALRRIRFVRAVNVNTKYKNKANEDYNFVEKLKEKRSK